MRIMFYSEDKTEGLSLEHSISDNSESLPARRQGKSRTDRSFCNKGQGVRTSKDDWN